MIPEIIDLPHVHLDPVVLILYFAILYMGCVFNANNLHASQVSHYATSCYLACLRTLPHWQREVQGSTMEFVAALFMVSNTSLIAVSMLTEFFREFRHRLHYYALMMTWSDKCTSTRVISREL